MKAAIVLLAILAGCVAPGAVQGKADISATVQPTSMPADGGDLEIKGDNNKPVQVSGNAVKIDGGTLVGLAAVIIPCVIVGYLVAKGMLRIGTGAVKRATARRDLIARRLQ